MFNLLFHRPSLTSLIATVMLLTPAAVFAAKDDFKQPIKIKSENQSASGIEKAGYYRGNVHISQGSLIIDADEVDLIAKDGAGNEIFIARGNPAIYQQDMDDGSKIKAQANEIKYTVANRVLTLAGDAEFHQNSNIVKAESILFDMQKEQLSAQGSNDEEGRVTTIFQPETQEENNGNP